jgi:hypothetical protein
LSDISFINDKNDTDEFPRLQGISKSFPTELKIDDIYLFLSSDE